MRDTAAAVGISIPPVPIRGNLRVRGRRSLDRKAVEITLPHRSENTDRRILKWQN